MPARSPHTTRRRLPSTAATPSTAPDAGAQARHRLWRGDAALSAGSGSRAGRERSAKEATVADQADQRPRVEELIAGALRGELLREADKRGLTFGERIRVQRAERQVLHAMSPHERLLAYRQGDLSTYQLLVWWGAYPREIPRIDGHPEWIAATLVDVCESPGYQRRVPGPR